MKRKIIIAFSAFILAATTVIAGGKPEIIAHRGYWKTDGSHENSISSIKNAISIGVWGSEFDVRITADNVAVINHDPTTCKGDTIEKSTLKQVQRCVFPNKEKIPTLKNYLKAGAKGGAMKLIVEIKPHMTPENDKEAVAIIMEMIKDMKLEDKTEYISFSDVVCDEIVRLAPGTKVAYLKGDMTPAEAKERGYTGIDYSLKVMRKNEKWFHEAHQLGLTVNVWTVDKPADIRYLIEKGVDYITTNAPETALKITTGE